MSKEIIYSVSSSLPSYFQREQQIKKQDALIRAIENGNLKKVVMQIKMGAMILSENSQNKIPLLCAGYLALYTKDERHEQYKQIYGYLYDLKPPKDKNIFNEQIKKYSAYYSESCISSSTTTALLPKNAISAHLEGKRSTQDVPFQNDLQELLINTFEDERFNKESLKTVSDLLKMGATLELPGKTGKIPIYVALYFYSKNLENPCYQELINSFKTDNLFKDIALEEINKHCEPFYESSLEDQAEYKKPTKSLSFPDLLQNMLIDACEKGNLGNAKKILSLGADPNLPNEKGKIPIFSAAYGMNLDLVRYLSIFQNNGTSIDYEGCKKHNLEYYGQMFFIMAHTLQPLEQAAKNDFLRAYLEKEKKELCLENSAPKMLEQKTVGNPKNTPGTTKVFIRQEKLENFTLQMGLQLSLNGAKTHRFCHFNLSNFNLISIKKFENLREEIIFFLESMKDPASKISPSTVGGYS